MRMSMPEFQRRMKWWKEHLPLELRHILRKAGMIVRAHAQKNYMTGPRASLPANRLGNITGTLKRSLHVKTRDEQKKIILQIGTNINYARQHEYGLGRMPERPFLRPAIADKQPRVMQMIADGMMGAWRKARG